MKLKKILNEILTERKQVGTVYHFTDLYSSIKIVETDILKSARVTKNIDGETVSTTRNKNFVNHRDGETLQISGGDIGFELDGNALSARYKVMPYDDTFDQSDMEYDVDDKEQFGDEMEELWFGNALKRDGGFTNLKKYVTAIIITKKFKNKLINSPNDIGNNLINKAKTDLLFKFPTLYDEDVSAIDKLNQIKKFFTNNGFTVKIE